MNGLIITFYICAAAAAIGVIFKIVVYFCGDVYLWLWRHIPSWQKRDLRDDHPDFFRKDLTDKDEEQ